MILEDTVRIQVPRERIFSFFERMDTCYTEWHPDHIEFRWVKGKSVAEGNEFLFKEKIAGSVQEKTMRFTKVVAYEHIEFTPTSWLVRLLMPRLLFRIQRDGSGSRVTAEIHVRTGPLGAWLNRREFDAVRQHMHEEGENMKQILEGEEERRMAQQ